MFLGKERLKRFCFFGLLILILPTVLMAQEKKFTISGNITDSSDGEDLIGAEVSISGTRTGTVTNPYGFYSISLPRGSYQLRISYIGYYTKEVPVELNSDVKLNISLDINARELDEVIITAENKNVNVTRMEMGMERLTTKAIKAMPALMGEVDVIKAIQLLPGVQSTSEGSSGFSVRGGGHDQNLVLLDEATVYNASHLMGFFSVFNNDAIKDVTLYKGDIPASFGGRLSSLMDIRTKDGNNQRFTGTGGIGLIASRLTLEGPIAKDRSSFLLGGRRTYADLFLKLSNDADMRKSSLYFYDINAKVNYKINDKNRIFLAGYFGNDHFSTKFAGMDFGNKTVSARWNHIFSPKLFSNFTLIGSAYDYYMRFDGSSQLKQDWKSQMQDYGLKADFSYHLNINHNLKFGYNGTYHNFIPGEGGGVGDDAIVGHIKFPHEYAWANAFYVAGESSITRQLKLKYGLRYSMFQNIGNGEEFIYLENYKVRNAEVQRKGKIFHTQGRFEPRFGGVYLLNEENSIKASYSRTVQYIQLASNSSAGSPLDIWFQASPNVKPQLSDQVSIGYFRNFGRDYEASAEIYYKKMSDVVDFKDHAELLGNKDLEQELRFGKGYAYGLELMVRKNTGRLNGWVSYTFAKSQRKIDEINDNKWYRSPYDKPVNISVVANYELSRKWTVSGNWVYASGAPVTYPTGRYLIENNYVPIYSGRNEYRYPAYHRLDLSAICQLSKPGSKFKNELNFSLYNAYGRKNPWTIIFRQENDQPDVSYAEVVYLFTFIPSITWNFTF